MGLLEGKTAIITGSARGIGRATAELFVSEGAQVTINDIDGDVADQASNEIKGETISVSGDLTKPGACDEVVKKTLDAFGKVDIVVNNAGYTWDGVVHRMTDEQFQAMLEIHTVVPFRMIRAVAPHYRDAAKGELGRGEEVFRKIINITSISGSMGNAGQANYSSGKAGVIGLTKTIAKEWGQFKVNVNAIAFGFVETRLTQAKEKGETIHAGEGGEEISIGIPEQMRSLAAAIIPLGRAAQPEEAAAPVLFLASPLSNYVHGQIINVTGGQFGGMYT
jgi:3-oxoacyl-[acyl-carrier protein] reductase